MNLKKKRQLTPQLRFPEFRDAGDWEEKPLEEISERILEKVGDASLIPVSITAGYGFVSQKSKFGRNISGAQYKNYTFLRRGDFAYNRGNSKKYPQGYVCQLKEFDQAAASTAFICFRLKNGYEASFIQGLFDQNTHGWQLIKYITSSARSDGLLNINKQNFFSIILPIPPLEEQQKIADCLTSLDDLIAAHTQKLHALRAHKKGLLQQLFPAAGETVPQLRFPEFRDAPAWERKRLIDVTNKKVKWSFTGGPFGSNLKASDYTDSGIRIIQLQNIGDAEFIDNYKIFTSEQKADELLSCNIYPGEIILSKMGDPVARACLVPNNHQRYVMCSDGIRLVVDEKKYDKFFIYSFINSARFRRRAERAATGSTRKRIKLSTLKNLPIIMPKFAEQQKIADCLTALDDQIAAQTQKLDALNAHKKGLLQQLFPSPDELPCGELHQQ